MSKTHFSPLNDSETAVDIQTSIEVSETAMAFPRETPSKLPSGNDEEQNPLQYLPDGSAQQAEQSESVPLDQIDYLDGPQILHEYQNWLCCFHYQRVRRIKKKEDIEAGRTNKVTRVVETKEWLLAQDPPSDELYFWSMRAFFWTNVGLFLLINVPNILLTFYWLLSGRMKLDSPAFWMKLVSDCFISLAVIVAFLLVNRWMRSVLIRNDVSEARKQYKTFFLSWPFFLGGFFTFVTIPIFDKILYDY